ncbi:MAG: GNAT family protein [Rubrivivax sp.]
MSRPEPVTLAGTHATLRPLAREHHDGLVAAARDGELWRLWYTTVLARRHGREIERRLDLARWRLDAPLAAHGVRRRQRRRPGWPDRRHDHLHEHRRREQARVEIGSTWTAAATQRTALNTQSKRLLLGHAFESLGCIAVEFRTHRLNTQSRRAIERLGAALDGILRAHMVMANGTVRDTAVYSITAAERPTVKAHLDWQLERPREYAVAACPTERAD